MDTPACSRAEDGNLFNLLNKIINLSNAMNPTREKLLAENPVDVILYSRICVAYQALVVNHIFLFCQEKNLFFEIV